MRGRVAVTLGLSRNVCGLKVGSLVMPLRKLYFNSSCSKSPGPSRGPCSSTTTVNPARDSSRAMTPPAAPDPTTTKSTVSLGLNVRAVMSAVERMAKGASSSRVSRSCTRHDWRVKSKSRMHDLGACAKNFALFRSCRGCAITNHRADAPRRAAGASMKIPRRHREIPQHRREIGQALRDHMLHIALPLQFALHLEQTRLEQCRALRDRNVVPHDQIHITGLVFHGDEGGAARVARPLARYDQARRDHLRSIRLAPEILRGHHAAPPQFLAQQAQWMSPQRQTGAAIVG